MTTNTVLRIARETERFENVLRFYTEGLGLAVLGAFEDHDGFDGVMVGIPGARFHLEFTRRRGQVIGRTPDPHQLLVFYIPDSSAWRALVDRMHAAGYRAVSSSNPYWDRAGLTFEDPDGWRVVLENLEWAP
jgi:catechol 2,3-dioxygenase-like lactoylglutathione lyase family enzyme